MHEDEPVTILTQALTTLTEEWKTRHARFLHAEHIRSFARKMIFYVEYGLPQQPGPPHFTEETTPPLSESFAFFADALAQGTAEGWKTAFETTDFRHVLLLMGQRLTPGSLQGADALPPLREALLQSCFRAFNGQTSVAIRAWEKHVGRSPDGFYGEIKGNPPEKERTVRQIVQRIFDEQTWWNVFYHYKHGNVYEIRVPTGHGMRWSADGSVFIGFLEPFL